MSGVGIYYRPPDREEEKMSESKGPYSTGDSVGLVFKDGRGVERFDSERDKLNACRLANAAWSQGRASRDGLREVLEGAQKFVIDQIAEIGACDHSVGHCECEVIRLAENIKKALEDDGEGR